MSLRATRFPPIPAYINKRFGSQQSFLSFFYEKTGIRIKKTSYEILLTKIYKKIGKSKLLSLLNLKDENEAEMRVYLFDALYRGLIEASWGHQLSPLYEKITGKKIKIRRKIEKRKPAHEIAFFGSEEAFKKAWIDLYKEGILPITYHYGKLTIGALGWLKSSYHRVGLSTIYEIISKKFDKESGRVILNELVNALNEVIKKPEKFGISSYLTQQLRRSIKRINIETDENVRHMMVVQLIETYLDDDMLIGIINSLIAKGHIKPPKVSGLYERFPYSFSNWIITPYGVFKISDWFRNPIKKLADLLQKKVRPKYLEPELEHYHGEYSLRVLEYCLRENPEKILKKLGAFNLREIAEELGISAAAKIKDEKQLIRLILLKLGFNLPPILYGLREFEKLINECPLRLQKNEPISSLMSDIYGALKTILRDINYFYICFLWKIPTRYGKPDEIERQLTEVVRKLKVSDKPFLRLTFGEHIKLLRTINKKIRENKEMKNIFSEAFNRNNLVPRGIINLLDEISPSRSHLFAHKELEQISREPNQQICKQVIAKVKSICRILKEKKVYPLVIRITKQITNEYGVQYFEAIDEFNNQWIVEYSWLDPSKPYFMYSRTNPVAVNPIIIEKIF